MGSVGSGGPLQLMVKVECKVRGIGADFGPEQGEIGGNVFKDDGAKPPPLLLVLVVPTVLIDSFEVVDCWSMLLVPLVLLPLNTEDVVESIESTDWRPYEDTLLAPIMETLPFDDVSVDSGGGGLDTGSCK